MAVNPEHLGDVEEGTPPPASAVDELGLTPDERAAFDAMKDDSPRDGDGPADPPPEPAPGPDPAPPPVTDPKDPAPPVAADDDDEPDLIVNNPKTGKAQKTVSVGKHNRLLTKAQQQAETLRQQIETERVERAKLAERLAILNEALTAQPPPPPKTPEQEMAENPLLEPDIDPNEDAIAAVAQANRRMHFLAQQLGQTQQTQHQTQEQIQEQQADQALLTEFQRDTAAFSSTEEGKHFMGPDGAYQFLKNSRLIELGISLFDKDPTDPNVMFTQAEIDRMVRDFNAEEKWVVNNAISQKKSPSQAILKLAKGRGWKPPAAGAAPPAPPSPGAAAPAAAPPAPAAQPPAAANGAPPPLAQPPAAPQGQSAVARIQAEAEAAAGSRSLSDGGGAPPPPALDADRLLKMSDAEFGRYVDSLPKETLDSIMGREEARPRY